LKNKQDQTPVLPGKERQQSIQGRPSEKEASPFVASTFTLMRGNIIAQVITLASMPIVARLFPPAAFGLFAVYVSISGIVIAASHLRFNVVVLLPREEAEGNAVVLLGIIIVLVISLLCLTAVIVWGDYLCRLVGLQEASYVLYLIPARVLLGGVYEMLSPWSLRAKAFDTLAVSKTSKAIANRFVTLGAGFGGLAGPMGLISGKLTGELVSIGTLVAGRGLRSVRSLLSFSNTRKMASLGIRYKAFPKYAASALLQRASVLIPAVLLGVFFAPAAVGYFAFSRRILGEPMVLVGDAIAGSYSEKVTRMRREGQKVSEFSSLLFNYLNALILMPMFLLAVVAAEVVTVLFGSTWLPVAKYIQVLTPMFITMFMFRPIVVLFDLLEEQKERLLFNLILIASVAIALIAGGLIGRPLLTVFIYSTLVTAVVGHRILWLLAQVGVPRLDCLRVSGGNLLKGCLFISPVALVKYLLNGSPWIVLVTAVFSLIVYALCLLAKDTFLRDAALSIIRR
jgi:O-antigen/teichoic acid export membrane protein